jgi:hypothetical protein
VANWFCATTKAPTASMGGQFYLTNVTEDKVLALDPTFSRIIYFGASQIVVDPYTGALNGETRLNVLNGVDFVCTHQPSVCVGSA